MPWNEKFSLPLREEAFQPRAAIAGKDTTTLAAELLAMSDEEFRIAFKGSPMKRAKLRRLKRNAAVVVANIGAREDVHVLTRAHDCPIECDRLGLSYGFTIFGAASANVYP